MIHTSNNHHPPLLWLGLTFVLILVERVAQQEEELVQFSLQQGKQQH